MEVQLTPAQKSFARQAIETGRIQHESEAVEQALTLWETRERARFELLATLDAAEASLSDGGGRFITEQSVLELACDVKRRGHARLAAERALRD